jgi:transcriptional regulator with XRE-family HTH domain
MKKKHKENHPESVALGKEIRRRRYDMCYSQASFAYELHLGRSYYSGIERGERNLSVLNLTRIAIGLNTTLAELLSGIDEQFVKSSLKKR